MQQTGTLTEDGLDVRGVIEPHDGVLSTAKLMAPGDFQLESPITECLASCHSLIKINGKYNDQSILVTYAIMLDIKNCIYPYIVHSATVCNT